MIKLKNILNEANKMGEGKVNEANINPKLVKKVNQFVKGISKYYNIPEKSVKLTIKQIMGEGKVNEYGGSDFSKITSLQNYLTIDLDKFEKGLKDSKHKAIYKKARKQFMKTVSDVAWEHSKLHEFEDQKQNESGQSMQAKRKAAYKSGLKSMDWVSKS